MSIRFEKSNVSQVEKKIQLALIKESIHSGGQQRGKIEHGLAFKTIKLFYSSVPSLEILLPDSTSTY